MSGVVTCLTCAIAMAADAWGAPIPLTANEHPWGQFLPNSWCIVQTVTISDFEGRAVQSSQTVRMTLQSVEANRITWQESETLEVGGKIDQKQPRIIKQDFFQEPIQDNVRISQGTPVKLMIEKEKKVVPCAIRIYEQRTSGGILTTTIWYTPNVYPYIFRVEKILRTIPEGEGTSGQIVRSSVMLVQETSALKTLRSSRRNRTYTQQTVEKVGNTTKITDARCSCDVPGGLLESTTREFDAQNKEIRRCVSRMTNYFACDPSQRYRNWAVPVPIPVPVPVPVHVETVP